MLRHVSRLEKTRYDDQNSLCCGGSIANSVISSADRRKMALFTASELTKDKPDTVATACPLCKKTLAQATETKVADIAEIVAEALTIPKIQKSLAKKLYPEKEFAGLR